jgi:hypothetical protein
MVCGLLPLSANFGPGEVADGETLVLKLSVPMSDFLIPGLPEETNSQFRVGVELATTNVVG